MEKTAKTFFTRKRKTIIFLTVMLSVPVINWLVFWLFVNLNSILMAFRNPATEKFTFDNFTVFWRAITSAGVDLNISIRNTVTYFLFGVIVLLPLNVLAAFFLYKRILFHKWFRLAFLLPVIVSSVAITTVYKEALKPWGIVGWLVSDVFGASYPQSGLLGQASTATWMIVIFGLWTGFTTNVLIFSGAMTRIPHEVLESAKIDGCEPLREAVTIILPLIMPTVATVYVLAISGIFMASGPLLVLVNNANDTTTIAYWIYNTVFQSSGNIGGLNIVAAGGICMTAVAVPLSLLFRRFAGKFEAAEY